MVRATNYVVCATYYLFRQPVDEVLSMRAAVVRSFGHPPRFEEFELPKPEGRTEAVIEVLAAGLHPRVRSGASGLHYADTRDLPMVPGIDGVGRMSDGRRVYFVLHDTSMGSMSEQTIVDVRRCVPIPKGVDEALVAAAMNPAMSSWLALRLRSPLQGGEKVLVLGVTGNAGQMAVQVAKRLGAAQVVGAGRDAKRLEASKADTLVSLAGAPDAVARSFASAASDVDVVIDYLWGDPAQHAMMAMLAAREDRSRVLNWIQIGSIAGPEMALPSVALRSTNLRVMGSGQGSVSLKEIVSELPHLMKEIADGVLKVNALRVPLADVESTWTTADPEGNRVVFIPSAS
jgi:NADPH:quinone reductase-like Zn-dependent oxidoreductase